MKKKVKEEAERGKKDEEKRKQNVRIKGKIR